MRNDQAAATERSERRRPLALVASALLALLLGGSLLLLSRRSDERPPAAGSRAVDRSCDASGGVLNLGQRLPGRCLVQSFDDGSFSTIDDLRDGRPLVVNFWASWCVFCIKEMPDFQRVYDRTAGRVAFLGLDLLGVQAETRSAAEKLAARTGVRYPLAYDEDGELYLQVSPRLLMPTTVFVRADGVIVYRQFGPLDENDLQRMIRIYLGVDIGG